MANNALALLRTALAKLGIKGEINVQARELCSIMDHFNGLHWSDRDRYGEEIRKLRSEIAELKACIAMFEVSGSE